MSETLTAEGCKTALRAVIDPEIYQNIVDLGLVYDVAIKPEQTVDVTMTLTTIHCPMGPQILGDVEKVLKAHGAAEVNVNLVWDPPWTPDAMTDELKRELGMFDDEPRREEEPEPAYMPPPPLQKKKGFFARLFGG
jgi:metal-sulfur cluster biosynthetic enzyme